MSSGYWSIKVFSNPGIIGSWNKHCSYWNSDEWHDTLIPCFSSPHVNVLTKEESTRAYFRLQTIFKLDKGIRIILNYAVGADLSLHSSLYYHSDINCQTVNYNDKDTEILLEEMENPFDKDVLVKVNEENKNKIFKESTEAKFMDLIADTESDLEREVLLLFVSAVEYPLNILINTYKIYESICADLLYEDDRGRISYKEDIPKSILNGLEKLEKYNGYSNQRRSSKFLSRHGDKLKGNATLEKPDFNQIYQDLIMTIRNWFIYKYNMKYLNGYFGEHKEVNSIIRILDGKSSNEIDKMFKKILEDRLKLWGCDIAGDIDI